MEHVIYMHSDCVVLGVLVCLVVCLLVCLLRVAVISFVLQWIFPLLSEPYRCVIIRRSLCNVIPSVL